MEQKQSRPDGDYVSADDQQQQIADTTGGVDSLGSFEGSFDMGSKGGETRTGSAGDPDNTDSDRNSLGSKGGESRVGSPGISGFSDDDDSALDSDLASQR